MGLDAKRINQVIRRVETFSSTLLTSREGEGDRVQPMANKLIKLMANGEINHTYEMQPP